MLIMVVLLTLIQIVVHYVLIVMMLLVLPTGVLVLLYYNASYYPVRGGASGTGFSCGLYITNMSIHDNFNGYFIGAALSFKLSTHYPVHSGGPSNCDVSGAFLCLMSHAGSLTYWDNGAALL